jgi:hypothetical protein
MIMNGVSNFEVTIYASALIYHQLMSIVVHHCRKKIITVQFGLFSSPIRC